MMVQNIQLPDSLLTPQMGDETIEPNKIFSGNKIRMAYNETKYQLPKHHWRSIVIKRQTEAINSLLLTVVKFDAIYTQVQYWFE